MLRNFIKVILRYLVRSRLFTALNVLGLSIGLGCCIVIFLFIKNELSYDRFQPDSIYRVVRESTMNNLPYNIGITSGPFAGALRQDYPTQISDATRAMIFSGLIKYEDKSVMEDKLLLADKNFFTFFSYPIKTGEANKVLEGANNIVISKKMARKYFGDQDPIGKTFRMDNLYDLQVSGIIDDLPGNTHLQFEAVISLDLVSHDAWMSEWWNNSLNTYIKVADKDVAFLNASFPKFMDKYLGKDFIKNGNKIGLHLEPLKDIYFNYDTRYDQNVAHGDKRYLFVFGTIGIMMILLAAINYINLATAQTSQRAREVGIRKSLGSSKAYIAFQFLSESFVLCTISVVIALALAQAAIPFFNTSFGIAIPGIFKGAQLIYFIIPLLLGIALLAGGYPAFLLASMAPNTILKGAVKGTTNFLFVRKTLVVFQFSVSIFMIIATLFIGKQLNFMREKDLGFQPDRVVQIYISNDIIYNNRQSFRKEILQHAEFTNASITSSHPGGFFDGTSVRVEGVEDVTRMRTWYADEELMNTLNLEMAAGRFFSHDFPGDSANSVLLNETAVRQLGWTNDQALGKHVSFRGSDSKEIVGIVKDYHFTSVKEKIDPQVIGYYRDRGRDMLVKLSGTDLTASVATLQKIWDSYNSGFPMELTFLDDSLDRLYKSEDIQGRMFSIFSFISVLIACLGILGLAAFMAAQRKKEIGVRKVLGASGNQISFLLMKELLILVFAAILFAVPAGYWAIDTWMQGFAYRAAISPFLFVVGSGIVIFLAMLIMGFNAARAARENPVNSLRSE